MKSLGQKTEIDRNWLFLKCVCVCVVQHGTEFIWHDHLLRADVSIFHTFFRSRCRFLIKSNFTFFPETFTCAIFTYNATRRICKGEWNDLFLPYESVIVNRNNCCWFDWLSICGINITIHTGIAVIITNWWHFTINTANYLRCQSTSKTKYQQNRKNFRSRFTLIKWDIQFFFLLLENLLYCIKHVFCCNSITSCSCQMTHVSIDSPNPTPLLLWQLIFIAKVWIRLTLWITAIFKAKPFIFQYWIKYSLN